MMKEKRMTQLLVVVYSIAVGSITKKKYNIDYYEQMELEWYV